ncbi:MAG: hypothetical protein HY700_07590 [Gemmatimonadetes bacterium]|nr:hypothetical protein [Gemmatimonadota bacterium]
MIIQQEFFWNISRPDLELLGVSGAYSEVVEIIKTTQIMIKRCRPREFLNGTIPIRRGLDEGFKKGRWQPQEPKVADPHARSGVSAMDWLRDKVGIEIQVTADTSRMLNDFRRIEMGCQEGLIVLGIEITLMLDTANMCTDRIAFFEDGVKYVQRFQGARCIVLGLKEDGYSRTPLEKQITRQGTPKGVMERRRKV